MSQFVTSRPLSPVNGGRSFRADYVKFARKPLSSSYSALNALAVSLPRLPLSVLSQLWHLSSAAEADGCALAFEDIGLGGVEDCEAGTNEEKTFALHDLQYQHCVEMRLRG